MKANIFLAPKSASNERDRSGFTLIELLVVVAILAILAALLLPALSKAKGLGRSAVCKSNLRQQALGLRLYLDDYERYPFWQIWDDSMSATQKQLCLNRAAS